MSLIERIKSLLRSKTDSEISDFKELLKEKFGFERFLYATSEGLPIMGTFDSHEELSAKLPEIVKRLSELEDSKAYSISANGRIYTIVRITDEVFILGRGFKQLKQDEIEELIEKSRKELEL